MDFNDPQQRKWFFELHRGLPREGPGNRACSERALTIAGRLPDAARVFDVACGPGEQTLDLARALPNARITALDSYAPFLAELLRRAESAGVGARIETVLGDMRALPAAPGSIDLLWCEGAMYIMGVQAALRAWAPLLAVGGRMAFTEPVWLRDDVPAAARANWVEYPAMTDCMGVRAWIAAAGLRLLGDFVLPPEAWWGGYYGPLGARVESSRARFAGNAVALAVMADTESEIAAYRDFHDCFGYAFFVVGA